MPTTRVLKVGLIGGGGGAFIAGPHQAAVFSSGTRRVTHAALHENPELAMEFAEDWPYPLEKAYPSYDTMIMEQSGLPIGERIDYGLIATPNTVHYDPAMKLVGMGIPVLCEKPMVPSVVEADQLVAAVKEAGVPFLLFHTYLGHWTTRLLRYIVRSGKIGSVRAVDAYYTQGWLSTRLEDEPEGTPGRKQAVARTNPALAGPSCCGIDIGIHALMQLRYVTGLEVAKLQARLRSLVAPERELDDHFTIMGELDNGAEFTIRATQIAIGHKNDLGIKIWASEGTGIWRQEQPECLTVCRRGRPDMVYWRGAVQSNDGFLGKLPDYVSSTFYPSGHSEGLGSAFRRLHDDFENDVRKYNKGQYQGTDGSRYATVEDGRVGIAFIEAAIRSNQQGGAEVSL